MNVRFVGDPVHVQDWTLRRNCSITPRQLVQAYAAICAASGLVAIAFTLQGAWMVLAFATVELLAVGCAFVIFARHVADRERVALTASELRVERIEADRSKSYSLDPWRASVEPPDRHSRFVKIRAGAETIEVGRFVSERKRREFARELSLALRHQGLAKG